MDTAITGVSVGVAVGVGVSVSVGVGVSVGVSVNVGEASGAAVDIRVGILGDDAAGARMHPAASSVKLASIRIAAGLRSSRVKNK